MYLVNMIVDGIVGANEKFGSEVSYYQNAK